MAAASPVVGKIVGTLGKAVGKVVSDLRGTTARAVEEAVVD